MKPKQLIWRNGRAVTPFGVYQVVKSTTARHGGSGSALNGRVIFALRRLPKPPPRRILSGGCGSV